MKLPQGYVPGSGVHKATAYGGVGQRMMEKLGWQKGQGLGKEASGMTSALEVKEKKDTMGVGATGAWDWSHRFWEDAYNSAVQGVGDKKGQDGGASSSSSSSDDDSSDDEGAAARKPGQRRVPRQLPGKAKARQKQPGSDASSSSSSSGSSSGEDSDDQARAAGKKAVAHRDGTTAHSATLAELSIAAQLAKDPWGRWGGRGGKMARIRQQEEEEAAKARQLLASSNGLYASAPAPGADAGGGKKQEAAAGADAGPASQPQPPKKRIVVTLRVRQEQRAQRKAFVPTPATGWWGAGYFASAGCLEGMDEEQEEEGEAAAGKEQQGDGSKQHQSAKQPGRKTFNEDDQANLYMLVHQNQRVGHKGLGRSTTVNVAGGKWEGTRKTFGDEQEQQQQREGPGAQGPQGGGEGAQEVPGSSAATDGSEGGKKRRSRADAAVAVPEEEQKQEQRIDEKKNNKKKKKQRGGAAEVQPAEQPSPPEEAAPSDAAVWPRVKWLKVARLLLKKAPARRLKLEKLCKRMLEHSAADAAGPKRTMSKEKLTVLLHRKAKQSKVVIEGGFVSLPMV